MKQKKTLRMFLDDMGSFEQPGCDSVEDALWHVNNARDHDGLKPLSMEKFAALFRNRKSNFARFV